MRTVHRRSIIARGTDPRLWVILGLGVLAACGQDQPPTGWDQVDFGNVISLTETPNDARDLTAYAFSDLGAWHMYGLPGEETDLPGSFPGPFLLAEGGVWLSPWLIRPRIEVNGTSQRLQYDPQVSDPAVHYPGRLHQAVVAGPIRAEVDLVFATAESILIRARVHNPSAETLEVGVGWAGGGFHLPVGQVLEEGRVRLSLPESETVVEVVVPGGGMGVEVGRPPNSAMYRIPGPAFELGPEETVDRYALVAVFAGPAERGEARPEPGFPSDPEGVFADNQERWAAYLDGALGPRTVPTSQHRIAAKAVQTLISNWRSRKGHLFHAGLFPSYAYRGFHGVWSWDSWKHARALALFAPELAKDQMRVMLDHQNEVGMIPDVIYVDSTENNWRDTKPPLAAWAVHGIFQATADTTFVQEVYPALHAYHRWWYQDRDHDGNGLCEYGSTDGTRIAAAWESGMDNAVRFDAAVMVQNGPSAWSLNQESVDLNSYLYAEKGFLADLADALGRDEEAAELRTQAEDLGELIRTTMFDEEAGYFFDVDLETKTPVRVQGPEGWIPLWAGVATQEQAEGVRAIVMDPTKFAGTIPFPTLAMDHPEFDPMNGYWRGPVWLDQAYFGVMALERYGFEEDAALMRNRLLEAPAGLTGDGPIFENYHPVTGEGLNAPHFSWSAAHLLLLLEDAR